MNLYTYNPTSLEYEKVKLKTVLIIPLALVLGILVNYFIFRAEIIDSWQWKYSRGKELKKEQSKITIYEWIKQ